MEVDVSLFINLVNMMGGIESITGLPVQGVGVDFLVCIITRRKHYCQIGRFGDLQLRKLIGYQNCCLIVKP